MSAIATSVPWQPCEKTGWPAVQVKHMFDTALGKMLQPQPASDDDIEAPYIKSLHVQWRGVNFEDLPTMWASPMDIEQLELRIGDLMVCEGGEVGRGALVLSDPPPLCIFQNALHRVRARELNDVRYLNYCLKQASEAGWFDVLCNRATIAHFTVEKFRELRIHLPSSEVQRLIANYLDRETARIDGLIAEKERMLALLEEKRAALISRIVTRGLDPNVPLKPSGQEWLGEIPAHWKLERLKFHLLNIEQGWSPQCDSYPAEPDEWGVLKVGAVNSWTFNALENKRLPNDVEPLCEYEIKPRDVLMSRANTAQLLGSVVYVKGISSKLLLCDKIYRLNINDDELDREFLVAFLRASTGRYQLEREASGTSGSMQNIGQDTVQNAWVAIPPLNEQKEIARHLAESRAETEAMDAALRHSINLLLERRAALITAAVTGQIPLEEMGA